MEELTPQQREEYEELAMDIFVKYSPKDSRGNRSECASCETMIPDWQVTLKFIQNSDDKELLSFAPIAVNCNGKTQQFSIIVISNTL